jgi:hypothetical protein
MEYLSEKTNEDARDVYYNIRYILKYLIPIFMICLLVGCKASPVASFDLKTWNAYMTLASIEGTGVTTITVRFTIGGADVYLSGDDKLIATDFGASGEPLQEIRLVENRSWYNNVDYTAKFNNTVGETKFTITVDRTPSNPDIVVSEITLPRDISMIIQSPPSGGAFQAGDMINISWTPTGMLPEGNMDIGFLLNCTNSEGTTTPIVHSRSFSVLDSGFSSYDITELFSGWYSELNATCTARITLTRTVYGSLSTYFTAGSLITTRQTSTSVNIINPIPTASPTP